MKRTLLAICLCLLVVSPCLAQEQLAWMGPTAILGGGVTAATAADPADLLWENFDGTTACGDGVHTNCNGTWTKVGTYTQFDFNYATSPAPLEGTYSFYIAPESDTELGWTRSFTDHDAVHFFFIFNDVTRRLADHYFKILASDDTVLMSVSNVSPELAIYCGTVSAYTSEIVQGTTYYVWGDYTKGTGEAPVSNAICHLYVSSDATKPAATHTITNGNADKQAGKVFLCSKKGGAVTVSDKIRVNTTSIGSNPE
jgi:hypothetical protein